MKHWYYLLLFPLTFCFCSKTPESKNKIIRFDKELKYIIDNYSDSALVDFENNFSLDPEKIENSITKSTRCRNKTI